MNDLGLFDTVFELGFNGIGMPEIAYITFKTDLMYKLNKVVNFTCIESAGGFCSLNASCSSIASILPDYAF